MIRSDIIILIRNILSEDDDEISNWKKSHIASAIGSLSCKENGVRSFHAILLNNRSMVKEHKNDWLCGMERPDPENSRLN